MSLEGVGMEKVVTLIPHAARLGIQLLGREGDSLVFELPYNPELEAFPDSGLMANGAIVAFLDTALGGAVYDLFETFQKIVTLDLRVDYFEKPKPYSSVIIKTRCLKKTDKVVFVQGDAYCKDQETPIAHGVGVFSYAAITDSKNRAGSSTKGDVGQVS